MTREIKILVVVDLALLREALADRLDRESDFTVIGCASTADEAIVKASEYRPAVVLMDVDIPGMICFDAAKRIVARSGETRIVFLSGQLHDRYVAGALAVNAAGYLTKREPMATVITAIRQVAAGGTYFSKEVRSRIVADPRAAGLAVEPKSRAATLTSRELENLRYVARGLSKKEMAGVMGISIKTVDRHCANLMAKLDIHDRVDLARFAIREGIAEA